MRDRKGNPLRTVWILGAGFSRSLGGPLLPDLFRQEDRLDLTARYPQGQYGDLQEVCWKTQGLFNWGKAVERQWADAEQFIDFVDCAKANSPESALLLRMSSKATVPHEIRGLLATNIESVRFDDLDAIKSAAVRALAAECSWFWRHANDQTERWAPYRLWLSSLDGSYDRVVSFNYDGVLEKLARQGEHAIVIPNEARSTGDNRVRILKLHGSVTWLRDGRGCRTVDVGEVLGAPRGLLALGTPGQTKRTMKDELFEPLWREAEAAIRSAEAIVFLGYRFPETDGDARRRVLGAITANSSHRLRVRVVLGPNIQHPDAVRVHRLIGVCASQNRIPLSALLDPDIPANRPVFDLTTEPLLAEDYLALYESDGPLSRIH